MAKKSKVESAEQVPVDVPEPVAVPAEAPVEDPVAVEPAVEVSSPAEGPAASEASASVEDSALEPAGEPPDAEPAAGDGEPAPAEPARLDPPKPKGPRIPLPSSLQEIIGSLLFASESPLSVSELRTCVRGVAPEEGEDPEVMAVYQSCTTREIEQALRGLEKELERAGCGFRLVCAGGTYRLQTAPSCGRYVRALLKLDRPSRLSRASLETLAIIAYRQPITKAEIEQIRGVAVDTIVKSLVELQLVRLVGRSELPGHPFLYGTSPLFLEHFGLSSLSELNEIDPTLQRSNPRERAKLFVKEKKKEEPADGVASAEAGASEVGESAPEAMAPEDVDAGTETSVDEGADAAPRRVSFRVDDDEDGLIDDTPDAFDDDGDEDESLVDEDDESLVDDDGGDDESLVDDEDDDDEPLVDDDGDDDEPDDGDEDDEEGEEEEEDEEDEDA